MLFHWKLNYNGIFWSFFGGGWKPKIKKEFCKLCAMLNRRGKKDDIGKYGVVWNTRLVENLACDYIFQVLLDATNLNC